MEMKTLQKLEGLSKSFELKVEQWFDRHFNHLTPGTPLYHIVQAAKDDLKITFAPYQSQQGDPALINQGKQSNNGEKENATI